MFDHKDTRKRFNDMGVDLLWVSLGHIKTPEIVLDNRVMAWEAGWERETRVKLSEGEAHKLRLMEYAKAMARVDMIENMLKTLPGDVSDPAKAEAVVIHWLEALKIVGNKIGRVSLDPLSKLLTSAEEFAAVSHYRQGQVESAHPAIIANPIGK